MFGLQHHEPKLVQPRQARGGPQPLAMPNHDTISDMHLDGRDRIGAEKSLKAVQRALAFEDQAHDGALCCGLAGPLRSLGP